MQVNPYESPAEAEPLPQAPRDYTGCLIWTAIIGFAMLVLWFAIMPSLVFAQR